jgi:hypothetical protein
MAETENNNAPDASEAWFNERQARLDAERQRIEAQSNLLETTYGNLESRWAELDRQESDAHDMVETRELVRVWDEKQRLRAEAGQLQSGYQALQQEKSQIERLSNLDYTSLLENSSERSQMFLRAWKSRLEGDPASVRRLLHADSQVKAAGVRPDSPEYFEEIESRMGFPGEERAREFENGRSTTKRQQKLSAEHLEMSKQIEGLDPKEYIEAAQRTYTFNPKDDSHVYLDPNDSVSTSNEPEPEVRFEQPAVKQVKLPSRGFSKNTVDISPDEQDLVKNMALSTGRPEREVLMDFARNKLALHRGESSYQLHEAKRDQSIPSRHR